MKLSNDLFDADTKIITWHKCSILRVILSEPLKMVSKWIKSSMQQTVVNRLLSGHILNEFISKLRIVYILSNKLYCNIAFPQQGKSTHLKVK